MGRQGPHRVFAQGSHLTYGEREASYTRLSSELAIQAWGFCATSSCFQHQSPIGRDQMSQSYQKGQFHEDKNSGLSSVFASGLGYQYLKQQSLDYPHGLLDLTHNRHSTNVLTISSFSTFFMNPILLLCKPLTRRGSPGLQLQSTLLSYSAPIPPNHTPFNC